MKKDVPLAQRRDGTFNTLFLSVGRRVELLRACRRAYQTLDLRGEVIGVDADWLAPALRVADKAYLVPRLDSPDFLPTLLGICRAARVDLIFPLIDPDVLTLARHRQALEATGAQLAVVSAEAAAVAADSAAQTGALFVGPEGGWSPAERGALLARGFAPVGLGPRLAGPPPTAKGAFSGSLRSTVGVARTVPVPRAVRTTRGSSASPTHRAFLRPTSPSAARRLSSTATTARPAKSVQPA